MIVSLRTRIAAAILAALCLAAAPGTKPSADSKIDARLLERLRREAKVSFLVRFGPTAQHGESLARAASARDRRRAVYDELRQEARRTQAPAREWLAARSIAHRRLFVVNALQVEGDLALARALAARPEVERIVGDPLVRGVGPMEDSPAPLAPETVEWNVANVRAPLVWSSDGVQGEGIVVASADTGVKWDHVALIGHYRGWDGAAADHDYNWYDAIADEAVPLDPYGHGTHTTGTMIGDDGAGNQIGVAPGAKWIGCRNMNAQGFGSPSSYLGCIQFFLAPWPHGGDPELDGDPSKAPNIVNNSWGCPDIEGCDANTLAGGFAALEAAGILAVASAGNSGPSCSTVSDPPAIYDDAFTVGAITSANSPSSFSSRGPVTVDFSNRMKPDLAAPGSNVRSSVISGGYGANSGTSMASPHVAGSAALLWSARPELRGNIELTRCIFTHTTAAVGVLPAQICGGVSSSTVPNNTYGWGRVDAYAAIHPSVDADADHVPDACDCNPADGTAFAAPGEVSRLSIDPDRVTVYWEASAPRYGTGTVYDLIRGTLTDLAQSGGIAAAECKGAGLSHASYSDAEMPADGEGYYYLVSLRNACGSAAWGEATLVPRAHPSCP